MIFRQLFDRDSCTYTYLLADEATKEAVLIDPVRELVDRDMQVLDQLGLKLVYTLETHVHADHVTASGTLRQKVGSKSVLSHHAGADCADITVGSGDALRVGDVHIEVRETPGHTNTCVSYYVPEEGVIFTGDTLMIRGCGRTDFQQGSSENLYASVHEQIFTLPETTRIYPGHDYKGRTMSTVAEEKAHNPRLGGGNTVAQFVEIMANLKLSLPKKLSVAVPANQNCGLPPKGKVSGWAPIIRNTDGVPEVSVSWVAANLSEGFKVLDVREPHEWTGELGHIATAHLAPLSTIADAVAGWDPSEAVVTVCKSGGRSGSAAQALEALGFMRVASMAGGMTSWNDSSLPIATEVKQAAPAADLTPAECSG
ncbi:MAG: MBL fold metallo-hydrolase [Deltaproteobacteria bacterium]|nr:MBL fold metallo-hydrolase [Deltaproteobacteria bacterium]